ncbi:MAG: class I SAM-dependent methyltransferase [Chloroflexaceae bacterium]|nr:class I SAM-dependent methyltransferase [Chloroflexaceae bacterium]
MENKIQSLLFSLGVCSPNTVEEIYPQVRDRDDIRVLKCNKSGVMFLSRTDHIQLSHYSQQRDFSYWSASNRSQATMNTLDDDQRRARQFELIIRSKKWLDFGTGAGGILDLLAEKAAEAYAIEPQTHTRNELVRCGYKVFQDISQIQNEYIDIVTLFHVFEHLLDPIETLNSIAEKLVESGKIIIEVPHANDMLLSFFDLESFKRFTFWSEHLVLHTRYSLEVFLREAGFHHICVEGFQRYPLANHLYWLARGKPGGHKEWHYLQTPELNRSYAALLAQLDKTDTLIAVAEK